MFDFFDFFLYPLPMSKKPASSSKSAKAASPVTELPDGPAGEHGLTTRQLKILEVIQSAISTNGYPPTMREIGAAAGLASPASVSYQLNLLAEKGFIRRDENKGRAMEINMPGDEPALTPEKSVNVPLVLSLIHI